MDQGKLIFLLTHGVDAAEHISPQRFQSIEKACGGRFPHFFSMPTSSATSAAS
jgi:hypothetical protein